MDVRISKPLTVGDKKLSTTRTEPATKEGAPAVTYEVLPLDFDSLTGADVMMCASDAALAKAEPVRQLVIDHEFHIHLAAKACGLEPAALKKLAARDFVEVATTVQNFLAGSA